ncbi:MAG TPA: trypsin-like peptidase domain-containing protein [Rhizomicrobium sp.]|nr:trypsin-like peptidase domain-containing protein [Rhizomicrobium sp.]
MMIDNFQLGQTWKRFQDRTEARQRNLFKIASGKLLTVDTPARVSMFLQRRGIPAEQAGRLIAGGSVMGIAAGESMGLREPDGLERIMGSNDLMGIAFLERGLDVSRTVARIWVDFKAGSPEGYGTGFLISPRLLMTNHHVLNSAADAANSKAEFNYQLGPDGAACPPSLFALDPGAFFLTNAELDYSVVAVAVNAADGRLLSDFGFNPMLEEQGKAILGQWLNVIQHPSGGYKQLALRENNLVDISDSFLTYMTDTSPGSSGSPVYNDRWEVVGLHHSGVPAKDARGRTLAIDGQVWTPDMGDDHVKWLANEGIRISRIIADIRAQATSPGSKAFVDEMVAQASRSVNQNMRRPERRDTRDAAEPACNPVMTCSGDTATWTIPITLSVTLPRSGGYDGAGPVVLPVPGAQLPAPLGPLAAAKAELANRSDVLEVRGGYVFENGWITKKPAIVVKVRKRLAPAALRDKGVAPLPASFAGMPVEVVNPTIADLMAMHPAWPAIESYRNRTALAQEIVYKPPSTGPKLEPVTAKMKLTACVSPDQGWPVLEQFIGGVKTKLTVGMYDFGAPHIRDALKKAGTKKSFKHMTMAIQAGSNQGSGTKKDDLSDEKMVKGLKSALKSKFEYAWVKTGIKNGWVATSYHIKVAVRDSRAIWLSSGNWQSSNLPKADPLGETPQKRSWLTTYNRDWHIVLENADIAKAYENYIRHDFTQNQALGGQELVLAPDILLPGSGLLDEMAEERAVSFQYFKPFSANRKFTVQPLLTPDNYKGVMLKLIKGATKTLLIQNQTFNAAKDGQAELGELLDAILQKQNAGVDVRIIFRILMASDARENLEALQDRGFDMGKVKVQKNCHTKGVIADGKRVMIGSQNLSQLGITLNRDASLLFEDAPLAAYFGKIFEHDWANLARQDVGSETHAPEMVAADEAVPAGMARISWKDYLEMA